jgi:hypothetical protein
MGGGSEGRRGRCGHQKWLFVQERRTSKGMLLTIGMELISNKFNFRPGRSVGSSSVRAIWYITRPMPNTVYCVC